jgi:hypothetical protein
MTTSKCFSVVHPITALRQRKRSNHGFTAQRRGGSDQCRYFTSPSNGTHIWLGERQLGDQATRRVRDLILRCWNSSTSIARALPVPRKPLRAATIVREAQSRRQDVGDILISEAWPFLSNAGSRGVRKPQSLGARRSLRCDSASTGAKDGFPLGERQRTESPVIYQGNFTVLTKLKYGLATLPFSSCPDALFRDLPTAVSLFP